jgi:hypothetical protein
MRRVIPEIVALLAAADQRLRVSREVLMVWDRILDRFSDAQLRAAALAVAQRPHYGAPTAADLIIAIEGVERAVRLPKRNLWNTYDLDPKTGAHVLGPEEIVRHYPYGRIDADRCRELRDRPPQDLLG